MVIEIIVMFPIQDRQYRPGIDNLLVLLIGGIPIAMPTVLSVTMAIGSHRLAQQVTFVIFSFNFFFMFFFFSLKLKSQGAITKRMTAIEEMAGMDVLCSDKTGTLTLNKLTVDKNLIDVSFVFTFLPFFFLFTSCLTFWPGFSGICQRSRCRYCCPDGSSSIKNWKPRCHWCCHCWHACWPKRGKTKSFILLIL